MSLMSFSEHYGCYVTVKRDAIEFICDSSVPFPPYPCLLSSVMLQYLKQGLDVGLGWFYPIEVVIINIKIGTYMHLGLIMVGMLKMWRMPSHSILQFFLEITQQATWWHAQGC
jgi:hypothetical protein